MASLGMLVAGIAHEINTPVGAIASTHDTLVRAVERLGAICRKDMAEGGEEHKQLESLFGVIADSNRVTGTASARVTEIVKRLRSFARLDEAEMKTIDIHESIEDTLVILSHELKHGIEVERRFGDIPGLACYPGRINQVLLNILKNASQAISPPGKISIETAFEGGEIRLTISDTGCGIDPDQISKIFDPGFTTKGVRVGTGLGLSITYRIIQDHGGRISVDSKVGHGTTFTIHLPVNLDEQPGGDESD
jgi:signal transduction histidine kinase